MEQNNQQVEARVTALEQWKQERITQQIAFPLDVQSQKILSDYFMHINSLINYEIIGAASHVVFTLIGSQGQQTFQLSPQTIFQYTVNPTNDTLHTDVNFVDGTSVQLNTTPTGTFPAPLAINTPYYVVSSSGNTFKLSLAPAGAPINITTTGLGPQYISAELL